MNQEFIDKCKEIGIHECGILPIEQVPFEHEVREMCAANRCGLYGKKWCCPPGCGTEEECKEKCMKYKNVFVFSTKYDLEDSFDFEGMERARKAHDKTDEELLSLLDIPCELAGAGSCTLCEQCTYPDAPCRFPDKARCSVEACGIDVVKLSSDCGINYINGKDTVTYFSILFW